MNTTFHRYVKKIVQQTDAPPDEQEDLYEELLIHLEMSYEQYVKEGYSPQEAEQKTLESFGIEENIGQQIQQAMFPYRKEMLLILATASLLLSFSVYVSQLIIERDALITWLLLSVAVSVCLLFFSIQPVPFFNRRLWMNSLLITHLAIYLIGAGFASSVDAPIATPLIVVSWGIILLTIALVYRTTIFDYQSSKLRLKKQQKIFHALNITWGIIIISSTLFFLWAFLAFGGGGFTIRALFILTGPVVIWIATYSIQMALLKKGKKKVAYFTGAIPFALVLAIVIWFAWGVFG